MEDRVLEQRLAHKTFYLLPKYFLIFTLACVALVATFSNVNFAIATLAYALMTLGFLYRKGSRPWHIGLMISAITLDVGLVLFLQFTRDALGTTMKLTSTLAQHIHIFSSLLAVLCYIPLIFLGMKLLKNNPSSRPIHKWLGIAAYLFRTIGFVFMFSQLDKN